MLQDQIQNFKTHYATGVNFYLAGNWEEAKKYFEECKIEKENDGPTTALLDFMGNYHF